ncbi:hypothetical protein CDAR_121371 [Caerostris darwini]|uniref:Uncharacterized protein n=1 Tax=Caerostris darwini TaxID=1538125 RepID=A0AAV4W3G8_9ARAC|nr:hypothetical protein CDAR_121371 [Caerostris darwini]
MLPGRSQRSLAVRLMKVRAYSEVLRKANQGKQVSHAPQPIIAQEEPLPCANSNRPAPAVTERVVYNSECSLSEIFQCLMDLAGFFTMANQKS